MKQGVIAFCFAFLASGITMSIRAAQPVHQSGVDVPDIATGDNLDRATAQAQRLLVAYRQAGWDVQRFMGTPGANDLLILPVQDQVEEPTLRLPGAPSFALVSTFSPEMAARFPQEAEKTRRLLPLMGELAFFSETFVRKNIKVYPHARGESDPSGVYIIGWKNGRVEQIPWQRVRTYPTDKNGGFFLCFPGMPAYREDLPRPSWAGSKASMRRK